MALRIDPRTVKTGFALRSSSESAPTPQPKESCTVAGPRNLTEDICGGEEAVEKTLMMSTELLQPASVKPAVY